MSFKSYLNTLNESVSDLLKKIKVSNGRIQFGKFVYYDDNIKGLKPYDVIDAITVATPEGVLAWFLNALQNGGEKLFYIQPNGRAEEVRITSPSQASGNPKDIKGKFKLDSKTVDASELLGFLKEDENLSEAQKPNLQSFEKGIEAAKKLVLDYEAYFKSVKNGAKPVSHKKDFVKAGKELGHMLFSIDTALVYSLDDPDSFKGFEVDVQRNTREILANTI